jgi:hypothetical protein
MVIVACVALSLSACGTSAGANPFAPATTPPSTAAASPPTVAASTPPPAPATTAVAAPTTEGDRRLTLAFTGDALWHSPLWRQAERNYADAHPGEAGRDFTPMLAELTPVIAAADLGVCHLETPIAPEGEQFTTHPLYGVPPEVVTAIAAAGFDRCSLASNHVADRGPAGIDRTVSVLDEHGLGHAGMATTPAEIEPQVFTADGVRISHLAYTYGYNGLVLPAGEEWRSALIDPPRIIADARTARRLGAQVVMVSMHWGSEGTSAVTAEQRRVAEQITDAGDIDLIVGHHAHVLQPIEQVNGVWVVYGLGNMISNMPTGPYPPESQDGAVAVVDIAIGPGGTANVAPPVIHPTWVDRDHGWIVHVVDGATLADEALDPWLRGRMETSRQRTQTVLGEYLAH